ncbi:hypothetical protein K443DRAFT_13990 [Laccaria amethystina LaAM-08-1]|uniref:Uncharacterized protein n=1 Tax=Laccaria amethystina LaAM-08-1 TaxID=1095629 RepID=A0A0C9X2S9_9AGAR|nr:hypothetical protein K443DRAFT_13990 [Laccaria amethystina LaAM-08-1]
MTVSSFFSCPLWLDINAQRKIIDNTTTPNAINRHRPPSTSPLSNSHNPLLVLDFLGSSGHPSKLTVAQDDTFISLYNIKAIQQLITERQDNRMRTPTD